EFPVATARGLIDGKLADPRDVATYAPLMNSEWSLYPHKLIEHVGLKRIILCSDLSLAGQSSRGLSHLWAGDLYVNVERGMCSELFMRKIIHHEFFHMIDDRNGTLTEDERWSGILPRGLKYESGGLFAEEDSGELSIRHDLPGFLNTYSMSAMCEDKAEI